MDTGYRFGLHRKIKEIEEKQSILEMICIACIPVLLLFVLGSPFFLENILLVFVAQLISITTFFTIIVFAYRKVREMTKEKDKAFAELIDYESVTRCVQLEGYDIISYGGDGKYCIAGHFFRNGRMETIQLEVEIVKSDTENLKLEYKELSSDISDTYKAGKYKGKLYVKKPTI